MKWIWALKKCNKIFGGSQRANETWKAEGPLDIPGAVRSRRSRGSTQSSAPRPICASRPKELMSKNFLDLRASVAAPTLVSTSIRNTFRFPLCRCLWTFMFVYHVMLYIFWDLSTWPKNYLPSILDTCHHWDIWSEWWGDMTWPKHLKVYYLISRFVPFLVAAWMNIL